MIYQSENIVPGQILQRVALLNEAIVKTGVIQKKYKSGGPYDPSGKASFYVGDIWVMAGGTNMEGRGFIKDPFTAQKFDNDVKSNIAYLYNSLGIWQRLQSGSLGDLIRLPDSMTSGFDQISLNYTCEYDFKTASLIPSFVNTYANVDPNVPVGLVACTRADSTLNDWKSPEDRTKKSLYTEMLSKINKVGGNVAGILWYQGESDANDTNAAKCYYENLKTWIAGLRKDLNNPTLPVVIVQIGPHRFDSPELRENWNQIQEAQYRLFGSDRWVAFVSSIDAELDSCTDLSATGLSLLGRRLAIVARKALAGLGQTTIPTVSKISCQKFTYYCKSISQEIMSISLDFNNLQSPWNICSDQSIHGFSVNQSNSLVAKAVIENAKTGTIRLYLIKIVERPFTISYGMQPGVANLVTKDGIALPVFQIRVA